MTGTIKEFAYQQFFEVKRDPLPGGILFNALTPPEEIVLAANPRVSQAVIEGIMMAAKDMGQIVILELALSEMKLTGKGYSGLTPSTFHERIKQVAKQVGWYGYVLHADHVKIQQGSEAEIETVKRELDARINAGFTSYAIDSSYLFDRSKSRVKDQLKQVIDVTVELFNYIDQKVSSLPYGKEGEVGEIGVEEFTTVDEAVYFLDELRKHGIDLNCLAIANGTKHGVSVDSTGKIIPQLGINLARTLEIVEAIKLQGYKTRIVQHGISGTPIEMIRDQFPKGSINKGNVATHWMLIVWDMLKEYEPNLYKDIYAWTIEKYSKPTSSDHEIFTKNSKYAIKEFFNEINNISLDAKQAIRSRTYDEAMTLITAFGMTNTAKKVYHYLQDNNFTY